MVQPPPPSLHATPPPPHTHTHTHTNTHHTRTFCLRDIDGIDVKIAGTAQPFQRALAWQAAGAIDLAREHKRLPATLDVDALNFKVLRRVDACCSNALLHSTPLHDITQEWHTAPRRAALNTMPHITSHRAAPHHMQVASEYDEQEAMQTWLAQCSLAGAPEEQASIEEGEEEDSWSGGTR